MATTTNPSSGPISFADLRRNFKGAAVGPISLREMYRDNEISNLGLVPVFASPQGSPSSGRISLRDLYSIAGPVILSQTSFPNFLSNCADGSTAPAVLLSRFFPDHVFKSGQQFVVKAIRDNGCGAWPANPIAATFTYGTAATVRSASTGGKSTFIELTYDGIQTVTSRGFYSGEGTSQSRSIRFFINEISLV